MESAAGWAVLSQSYKVLRVDAEAPAGLVRIDGAQADAPAPGQPVKFTEEDKLSVLQTVLSKAQAQGLGPISEVDLTNTLELSFLYQDRIRIVLGTTNDLDCLLYTSGGRGRDVRRVPSGLPHLPQICVAHHGRHGRTAHRRALHAGACLLYTSRCV